MALPPPSLGSSRQDQNRQAILSRVDDVLVDYRVLAREHGTRLTALETKIGQFNEQTLHPLIRRFEQLEEKMVDVEKRIQESTSTNDQVMHGVDELRVMGGWNGLVDRVKAEIIGATATASQSEIRLQSEIVQRFEALSQLIGKRQDDMEKRNEARLEYLLNSLLQPLTNLTEMCRTGVGRDQTQVTRPYDFSVSIMFRS